MGEPAAPAKLHTRDEALAAFRGIPWDSYVRAGGGAKGDGASFLTAAEVATLRAAEEATLEYSLADPAAAAAYAATLRKVIACVNDAAPQRYALTRVEDILLAEDCGDLASRAAHFLGQNGELDAAPFLRAMAHGDAYCKRAASAALATLLNVCPGPLDPFISWLCEQLAASRGGAAPGTRAAVPALTILLRREDARRLFGQHGGVGYLTKLLKTQGAGANAQLLYELSFCLWTLSFCADVRPDFLHNDTIGVLVEQVTSAPREKVVRVSLASLRNLCQRDDGDGEDDGIGPAAASTATSASDAASLEMIKCNLPKVLKALRERKWSDDDIADDVEALHTSLLANYRELSTFERYQSEVNSGQLRWGLIHTEKFWRENCKSVEGEDFKLLKRLVALLRSDDSEVAAIACYDIGEWVRFYPAGKAVVKALGAKEVVMELIEHTDGDVQRHALQCVSKIMVTNWEFVR